MIITKNNIDDLKSQIEGFVKDKVVDKEVDNFNEMSWQSHIDTIFENGAVVYDENDVKLESFLKVVTEILEEDKVFKIALCRDGSVHAVIRVPYMEVVGYEKVTLTTGVVIEVF